MIESDYKIVQDNGMDIDIFEPNEILKRLPDKVNIRGPNSKGSECRTLCAHLLLNQLCF